MAPAITLNRMYHCVPSSISTTAPTLNPPPTRTKSSSTTGNNAVAGTDAAICASGCAMRASLRLKPIATPAGMVQSDAMSSATMTRTKVAPAAVRVDSNSITVTPFNASAAWNSAHAAATNTATPTAGTIHVAVLEGVGGGAEAGPAAWSVSRFHAGCTVWALTQRKARELTSRCRMGEVTLAELSTCSNLKRSDQAISGRQT